MVDYTYNVSTQETEGGALGGKGHPRLQRVPGQPGLYQTLSKKSNQQGTGEVPQWLEAVFPEDPGLIPSTTWWFTTICDSSSRETELLFWPLGMLVVHTYTCRQSIRSHF